LAQIHTEIQAALVAGIDPATLLAEEAKLIDDQGTLSRVIGDLSQAINNFVQAADSAAEHLKATIRTELLNTHSELQRERSRELGRLTNSIQAAWLKETSDIAHAHPDLVHEGETAELLTWYAIY
jgi:hypothetical protein